MMMYYYKMNDEIVTIYYDIHNKRFCAKNGFVNGKIDFFAHGKLDTTVYLKDGKYHRENGPAVEYSNGTKSWYVNGIHYKPTEHVRKLYEAGNL